MASSSTKKHKHHETLIVCNQCGCSVLQKQLTVHNRVCSGKLFDVLAAVAAPADCAHTIIDGGCMLGVAARRPAELDSEVEVGVECACSVCEL
jgi:hypothetical protein